MPVNQTYNNRNLFRISISSLIVSLAVLIPAVFSGLYAHNELVATAVNAIFFAMIACWLICLMILLLRSFQRATGGELLFLILVPFLAIMAVTVLFVSILGG